MFKVSVIIPVYNVEKYLEKCLDSIVNQTLKDIEIIIVNDGSPDRSQDIIDNYVKKYPDLIKAFIKENRRTRFCQKLCFKVCKRRICKFYR